MPGHVITPPIVEAGILLNEDGRRLRYNESSIRLDRIPETGRIELVEVGEVVSFSEVRSEFKQTASLSETDIDARDATIPVTHCVDGLDVRPGERIEPLEVYTFEVRLAE